MTSTDNNYQIPPTLRKLQMVELDLLKELMRVCTKHGLRLWADSGTLLGALRHKGFIPWDDDIDMAMPRPDYDRLAQIAPQEFSHPYFFQNTYTDPMHVRGHAQLRNSNTTAILEEECRLNINHGVFIDIFPLDGVPDDEEQQERDKAETQRLLNMMRLNRPFRLPVTWNPVKMWRYARSRKAALAYMRQNGLDNQKCFRRFEDILRSVDYETAKSVGTLGFWYRRFKSHDIYSGTVMMPFEDTEIPAPVGYDPLLRIIFGDDYMTPKQMPPAHSGLVFDTERPYPVVQQELIRQHGWMKDFVGEIKNRM